MSIKKYLRDLVSNPDGSGSTKRTAAWLALFASFAVMAYTLWQAGRGVSVPADMAEHFADALLIFASVALGISSYDVLNNLRFKQRPDAGNNPPNSGPSQPTPPNA